MTTAVALLAVSLGLPACASKGYVERNVKTVDDKVETLSSTVQENQNRISKNEDATAAARQEAQAAQQAANKAQNTADSATSAAATAQAKAEEVDKASRKLVYEVVLSADEANFKFDNTVLPDEAKAKIDDMVKQLQANPQNVYFEIEGYTDSTGNKLYNEKLGMERAEAVKMYLYEQHHIPLHRMNTLSYGEDNPVAPNDTRDGRAQNRRVVIKVLA
jgi:outer membrane protein OmpA-like peptidoglycan-associated protein